MAYQSLLTAALVGLLFHSVHVSAVTVPETNLTKTTRACQPPHDVYPFCNASLPMADRVRDLISRLELSEIPPLLTARARGGESVGCIVVCARSFC